MQRIYDLFKLFKNILFNRYFFTRLNAIFSEYGYFKSKKAGCVDSDGNPVPWYTYPAIEYLQQFDFSGLTVFEYGSGNSSCYWASRALKVKSAEHNAPWFQKFAEQQTSYPNWQCVLQEKPQEYAAELNEKYDIIIIDAEWRDLCAREALKYIKDNGIIIIDDTERVNSYPEYERALQTLRSDERFFQVDFYGFAPLVTYTKITTFFISRKCAFPRRSGPQPQKGIGNF